MAAPNGLSAQVYCTSETTRENPPSSKEAAEQTSRSMSQPPLEAYGADLVTNLRV